MRFEDINTSSVLAANLAQPTFIGGEYVAGDERRSHRSGSADLWWSTPISPMVFQDATFNQQTRVVEIEMEEICYLGLSDIYSGPKLRFCCGDFGISIRIRLER